MTDGIGEAHPRATGSIARHAPMRSPPGTWRLLLPAIAAWVAAAWTIARPGAAIWLTWTAALLGLGVVVLAVVRCSPPMMQPARPRRAERRGLGAALLLCTAVVLVASIVSEQEHLREDTLLRQAAAESREVALDVEIDGFPRSSDSAFADRSWVRARALVARGRVPVILWLDGAPDPALGPGTRIAIRGTPRELPAGGAAYGIAVRAVGEREGRGGALGLGALAADLRAGLRQAAAEVPGAALVPGFAVGDTALVDRELDRMMQQSSLTHLTAVSGANCALVTGAVMRGFALAGAGRRLRAVVAAVALTAFVGVVGPDASVQRAAVMATVLLASGFGGKRASALPALGAAVLVLLLLDPWQALQPGFALSVAATGGILLLAAPCERRLRRLGLPRWLALPTAVALAAQLACGPLLLLLQPGLPVIGLLANVVAGPAAPLGTGLGLLALLLTTLGDGPAGLAVRAASLPAVWVEKTAEIAAGIPGGRWPWPQGWGGAMLLLACEAALLVAWALRAGMLSIPGARRAAPRAPWSMRASVPGAIRIVSAALVALAAGAVVSTTLIGPLVVRLDTPDGWAIVACDVGQGDAVLIRDPARPNAVMMVDTGDDPERLLACLDRFGVDRIALLVLTHDDRDHVGALGAVAPRTDAALISPTVAGEATPARPVVRQLHGAGTPWRIGSAGDAGGGQGLRWRLLAPGAGVVPSESNAASLVLMVQAGATRILLLADTGAAEQSALIDGEPGLRAEVLKVAHHGSRDQDARITEAVGAGWALISVGAENRYGHPADETIAGLARAGAVVLRTDLSGSVALVPAGAGGIDAWVERGGRTAGASSGVVGGRP